ncbi:antibiotic biosynthesis monooxygenase family protein [Paenisporosarcina cavernae]|uniref:Antibiotic biosynthesis monooxygenase n=1 Tax=Paenisporosarcina cavernae TaxID=2320858 RepID=A0A385YTF8_9BACL|nr:antibiotic biosynthesis monooxygenase [Paenisporosarcina cavernae]AYC30165.1 antibiotic biosynthesis monooxygenase [Paenisporosarcina cavernae]
MNIYLTNGTPEFMKSLKQKNANEKMVVMYGEGNAVLLHETDGKTVFATPRKYEVIDSAGELSENGFFVFNNIPVTEEGRPIFEHRFTNRARAIEDEPGFIAIRVLRPLDSDTYIVVTEWTGPSSFEAWQSSSAYDKAHAKRGTEEGIDKKPNIFSSASYVTKYFTERSTEEE